jgi:hypothetical protein
MRKDKSRKKTVSQRKKKVKRPSSSEDTDNSDVDKYGNIKGLIDYDYTSSEMETSSMSTDEESIDSPIAHRTRSSSAAKSSPKTSTPKRFSSLLRSLRKEKKRLKDRIIRQMLDRKNKSLVNQYKTKFKKNKDIVVEDDEDEKELTDKDSHEDSHEEEGEDDEDDKDYDEDDDEEDEEDDEEDDDELEEDKEEDGQDGDDEEEETTLSKKGASHGISISFGAFQGPTKDPKKPVRHNLKKENEDVNKFVKLVNKPLEENTIDTQIDQFKALSAPEQKKLIDVLEKRNANPAAVNPTQSLMFKIITMNLPSETQSIVLSKYQTLQNLDPGSSEYFKLRNWLDKLTSLPLGIYKELPVRIEDGTEKCNEFMARARKCLDDAIYGQDEAKLQILQFIGTKIANPSGRGLSLLLAGPPGIGKTSLIKNGIAKALEWPFQFISLGGDSDASTYTGHQLVYESSHCGKIVNSLAAAKSMSMVLMFDEVDKISTTPKGEEIQHLLIHLTDPVQNGEFEDKYLAGIPIDLSRIMFAFSANNLAKIDSVLIDRFVTIQLSGYSVKEKVVIAEQYIFPQALKELGLDERIAISKDVLLHIVDTYAKEEDGVRELKRCIEQIVQKLNMLRLFNTKELPFHIKDFSLPFVLKKEHVDIFLKKRSASQDVSFMKMYT